MTMNQLELVHVKFYLLHTAPPQIMWPVAVAVVVILQVLVFVPGFDCNAIFEAPLFAVLNFVDLFFEAGSPLGHQSTISHGVILNQA